MIGRLAIGFAAVIIPAGLAVRVFRRGGDRLLDAPRTLPDEATLGPAVDALGGEVVRLRSRDGLRLAARWLPAAPAAGEVSDDAAWRLDAREAILLLHGYSGSVAPDLVEYGRFLGRRAGVLGRDFRGHGGSAEGPTTFGLREIEDVAGALDWLAEHGIRRVAMVGTSMGGITAISATAVLGDGQLIAADADLDAPAAPVEAPRTRIVGIVGDSVSPDLTTVVANRLRGPFRGFVARRLFDAAARRLGEDPRRVEPRRMLPLLEDVPVLLVHGTADRTVPLRAGRELAASGGRAVETWEVEGADHSASHATAPAAYEERVGAFLRRAFAAARPEADAPAVPAADRTIGAARDPATTTL
jgi:pimeloyl-ACP methyl ester carboxylesterase